MTAWTPVADFDAAYDNSAAVPGSAAIIAELPRLAAAYREAAGARGFAEFDIPYGPHERHRLDLFRPDRDTPAGLVVYVHGGYWKALDKSVWSHLARGARDNGFAVAVPSYRLAPEARVAEIGEDVARAIVYAAGLVAGPIRLVGHSAGGHLVARQIASDSPLPAPVMSRIDLVVPISGLSDLRPIRRTRMNVSCASTSARRRRKARHCSSPSSTAGSRRVVGADELPELRRQTDALASAWAGLGARITATELPGTHHFDVVESLGQASGRLARLLTGGAPL